MISLDQCIRLGWRLVWYKILSVCIHGFQRVHPENPYEKDWVRPTYGAWCQCDRFHDQRPLDKVELMFQRPGVCADAQCWIPHGSKNLLQRVILYRHKKILCRQGWWRAISGRNYMYFWDGYLMISLDWSIRLIFCEPRYGQSASMGCSGVIQKIHTRMHGQTQGLVCIKELIDFMFEGL